jgi:hypothetical protein
MKLTVILVILCSLIGISKTNAQKKDTVILLKVNNQERSRLVYIDPSPNSTYYSKIGNNSASQIPLWQDRMITLIPGLSGIPTEWCELRLWKNKYYLFVPAGSHPVKVKIHNPYIVNYGGHENSVAHIVQYQYSENYHEFKVLNLYGKFDGILRIHILDFHKKIAVFEYQKQDGSKFFRLMTGADQLINYQIVVDYSPHSAQPPFMLFEDIDFEGLIAGAVAGKSPKK